MPHLANEISDSSACQVLGSSQGLLHEKVSQYSNVCPCASLLVLPEIVRERENRGCHFQNRLVQTSPWGNSLVWIPRNVSNDRGDIRKQRKSNTFLAIFLTMQSRVLISS